MNRKTLGIPDSINLVIILVLGVALKLIFGLQKDLNNDEIFSAFDGSPNTSLYLLGRQGIRIAKDFNKEVVEDIFDRKFEEKDTKFLPIIVINDYQFWKNLNLEKYQISAPIFTSGNLYICYFNKIK